MPGETVSQTVVQTTACMEGTVSKNYPERRVAEIAEVLKKLDGRITGPKDTTAADAMETVGMTSDNFYG
jgi:hypothetical protein